MRQQLLIISILVLSLAACSSSNPIESQGAMAPCPESPNCVSSQAQGDAFINPFVLREEARQAWPAIIKTVQVMPRSAIITQSPGYIHATQASRIFRFVDDLELELLADDKTINVRSASRTGYSDMGVNRERVESLRQTLRQQNIIE